MNAPEGPSSNLASRVQQFLDERRRLGFKLQAALRMLPALTARCQRRSHRTSDDRPDGAMGQPGSCQAHGGRSSRPWHSRAPAGGATAIHALATTGDFEPAAEVPDDSSVGALPGRVAPHIYCEAEMVALLDAARQLGPSDGLRAATYSTLFGLLASTGLRISEALNLHDADVDLDAALLTIRQPSSASLAKSACIPAQSDRWRPTGRCAGSMYVRA